MKVHNIANLVLIKDARMLDVRMVRPNRVLSWKSPISCMVCLDCLESYGEASLRLLHPVKNQSCGKLMSHQ